MPDMGSHSKTCGIQGFPVELLEEVFKHTTQEETKKLRMVCRAFAGIGARFLTKTCTFSCTEESLERLHFMGTHPTFAKTIRNIAFDCSLLKNFDDIAEFDTGPYEWTCTVHRFCRSHWDNFDVYCAVLNQQKKIFAEEKYASTLNEVMSALRRLDKVQIYVGRFQHCGPTVKEALRRVLRGGWADKFLDSRCCSAKQFLALMKSIANAGLAPRHLDLLNMTCDILNESEDTVRYVGDVFESVTHLKLDLTDLRDVWPIMQPIVGGTTFPGMFGSINQTENLSKIVSRAKGLISVDVSLQSCWVTLDHVIGNCTWDNLEHVILRDFRASEDGLVNFIKRHNKSLKSLKLMNVILEGSWMSALPKFRDVSEGMDIIIWGNVSNHSNEYWNLREICSFSGSLADYRGSSLIQLIRKYLRKMPGATTCPLNQANMSFW